MRCFEFVRSEDVSGVPGVGVVAQGVEFDDGTIAMRWLTADKSTCLYETRDVLERIHGHDGKTLIEWTVD